MIRSVYAQPVTSATDGTVLAARTEGDGDTVLLVHGFPGCAHSWRHQLPVLAAAGYRAVAVDLRGYGASGRPDTTYHRSDVIEADLIAVLDAVGADQAVVVGQDFGSYYAWNLARRRPERVRAVLGTVPYGGDPGPRPPSAGYAAVAEQHFLHLDYFQAPGRAETDLGGPRLRLFLQRLVHALSADGDLFATFGHDRSVSYLDALPAAPPLPWPWLGEAEFDTLVAEYAAGGPGRELAGGLASYRAADADWELAKTWAGVTVDQPSLLVMGEHDPVRTFAPPDPDRQRTWLTDLRDVVTVARAGHLVQQEQPDAFNTALLTFLAGLN